MDGYSSILNEITLGLLALLGLVSLVLMHGCEMAKSAVRNYRDLRDWLEEDRLERKRKRRRNGLVCEHQVGRVSASTPASRRRVAAQRLHGEKL